jgi:hypothetical protein
MSEQATAEGTVSPATENTPLESNPGAPQANPGPAAELRNIQMLLVNGLFPGAMSPQVAKSFHLLEQMALKLEKEAGYVASK